MNETVEKVKGFLKNYILYLAVLGISLFYIATSLIRLVGTGKTIFEIVADGITFFILGVLINMLMGLQGMMNGEREDLVIATKTRHRELVGLLIPLMTSLKRFCEVKNKQALADERRKRLSMEGFRYEWVFDEDGLPVPLYIPDGMEKSERKKLKRLRRKLLHLKLTPLTPEVLISDEGKTNDPYYFGRTKTEYERQSVRRDVLFKIVIATGVGFVGVRFIEFNWAELIWTCLQSASLIGFGLLKMFQSQNFVKGEYRERIEKKVNTLLEFQLYAKKENKEDGN